MFDASADEWAVNKKKKKEGNIQRLALTCSFKAVVHDCITTKKWQSARFWSFLSMLPCSTSWNNIICGVPSKVLHFPYFPLTVANFPPARQSDKRSLCQEKQATISLYKAVPTTGQAAVLGNQSQNYSWLPWQQNKLSGGPQRERGVVYPGILAWICYTMMLLRAYQNSFGWYTGMANNEHVYITSLTNK